MSVHTHARCDNCEQYLVPDDERKFFDLEEDELQRLGWFSLLLPEPDEDEDVDTKDFCSRRCLALWAMVQFAPEFEPEAASSG